MKKKFYTVILTLVALLISLNCSIAANDAYELTDIINLYKNGNYTKCYTDLDAIIQADPANALAHYYKAMSSAQLGKKAEAIDSYNKVLNLAPNNNLYKYAKKGKTCIETPDKCNTAIYENVLDEFIRSNKGLLFSDTVRDEFDKLKLEELKREMNRNNNIEEGKFKEFDDFSSRPTNDEIVAALRTLQKAGLSNAGIGTNNNFADLSVLTGNVNRNSMFDLAGNQNFNPQLIQALMSNSMLQGF